MTGAVPSETANRAANLELAHRLLAGLGTGAAPEVIAELFSTDVRFDVAGDVGALPWIGQNIGRAAVADFIRGTRTVTELLYFNVEGVLADDERAVIVGEFSSRLRATGRSLVSAFALILTVRDGRIARFQMLEDSFAVSRTARAPVTDTATERG